jgi:hypothetical protein
MSEPKIQITFDKGCARFIMSAFPKLKKECIFCGVKINKRNLGGLIYPGYFCGNIVCLVKLIEYRNEKTDQGKKRFLQRSKKYSKEAFAKKKTK